MQLALIILLALLGQSGGLKDVKPLLQTLGGDEAETALKQAEELSSLLSAVKNLSPSGGGSGDNAFANGGVGSSSGSYGGGSSGAGSSCGNTFTNGSGGSSYSDVDTNVGGTRRSGGSSYSDVDTSVGGGTRSGAGSGATSVNFPLLPILDIADDPILASLTRHIATR
jgi:hypothetical protein